MISKYAKLVEMLTRNFIKTMRRQPNNLENLKIKQQAAETIRQEQKIIPFKYKKTFGDEIKEMEEKGVGSLFKKTAETEDEILARLNKQNKDTIEKIKIRKQKTAEEIMDEGDFDPSGMATGGRVGFSKGKLVGRGITKLLERFAKDKKKSRLLTDDEIEEFAEELGDTETWMSSGTLKEAEEAAKRIKNYEQQMYSEYQVNKQGRKELEKAYKEIDFRMTGEDTKYEANELADMLAETRYKTEMSDLPQNTQLDLYDEAYDYLMEVKRDKANFKGAVDIKSGKNIVTGEQEIPIDPMTGKPRKLNANGGRVGFQEGGIGNIINSGLKNIINDYRLNELTPTKMYNNFQDHLGFNEFLRGQVGKQIDRETYNKLGGYDVTQRVVAGNPILGGLGNLAGAAVYNLGENFFSQNGVENSPFINEDGSAYNFQTITTGQPLSQIPGTVIRNAVGGSRLIPDDQVQLYRDLRQQYENLNTPTVTPKAQTASVNSLGPSKYSANATKSFDEFLKDEGIVPDTVNYSPGSGKYMSTDGATVDVDYYRDIYDKSYGTPNQTVSVNNSYDDQGRRIVTDDMIRNTFKGTSYNGEDLKAAFGDNVTFVGENEYRNNLNYGTPNQTASLNSMGPATYGTTEEEDLNLALGLSPGRAVTTAMDATRKYGPSIASFIFSGGLSGGPEALKAAAKQVAASKVSDALSERVLENITQQMARENQGSDTGGYQSSWGGVSDFMSGPGTSDYMGSFKKGGSVKKSIRERIINLVGGPSAAAAELGLEGILQIYDLLGMPLFAKGGLAKNKLTDTVPPEKGPDSQGVESLFRRK